MHALHPARLTACIHQGTFLCAASPFLAECCLLGSHACTGAPVRYLAAGVPQASTRAQRSGSCTCTAAVSSCCQRPSVPYVCSTTQNLFHEISAQGAAGPCLHMHANNTEPCFPVTSSPRRPDAGAGSPAWPRRPCPRAPASSRHPQTLAALRLPPPAPPPPQARPPGRPRACPAAAGAPGAQDLTA